MCVWCLKIQKGSGIHHTTQSSQLGPIIHRAVHQALSILEEVKGVSMAGVGWRLASSMGSACRWAMSSRGERAHTASQRAGERAVRSGACGEDGGAWAAGAPGSRASSAASRGVGASSSACLLLFLVSASAVMAMARLATSQACPPCNHWLHLRTKDAAR